MNITNAMVNASSEIRDKGQETRHMLCKLYTVSKIESFMCEAGTYDPLGALCESKVTPNVI